MDYAEGPADVKPERVWDGRGDQLCDARFAIIPGHAVDNPKMTGIHFRLLTHVGRQNAQRGWIKLSQTELAERWNYKRGSINRAIGELVEWKLIEKRSQKESGESFCQYRILPETPTARGVSRTGDTLPQGGVSHGDDTSVPPQETPVPRNRTPSKDHSLYASTDGADSADKRVGAKARPPTSKKVSRSGPEGIALIEAWIDFGLSKGLTRDRIIDEFERFHDYHLANGSIMKNWTAAWRNWVRNALRFSSEKPKQPRRGGGNNWAAVDMFKR